MAKASPDSTVPRFVVGIDLGTTNSAVAFLDTTHAQPRVQDFPIQQFVAPGEVERRAVLPSFHYQPGPTEFTAQAMQTPWEPALQRATQECRLNQATPDYIVGYFAREHGAAVPGRLIVSAKSWLSHSGVDRNAPLLPWHGAEGVTRLSPVEASRRYLAHMRAVWDAAHPDHPLSQQEVILTVPASFDEVARELTVEAARGAGMMRVTLLEEPQAAFYAWINAQGDAWETRVKAGQKILVCDVGGGTSDFTLINVEPAEGGRVRFHRVAVGEHLILGGDNLDLALAHHIERKLKGNGKLDPKHWAPLVRQCRALKEILLGENPPDKLTVSLAGGGSKLIGGATQLEVTRDEVNQLLVEGFLPRIPLDARPAARRSGFTEFGLPYAADPAITKYLAAFLLAHRGEGNPRPDVVLFNGGLFESPVLRKRMVDAISSWFSTDSSWRPIILENDRLDLAVARGAAYYGMVRRGMGVRISGGLARAYYIGVETSERARAICLLPAGIEEGQEVSMADRKFELLIRQPVEFPLYVSSTRTTDKAGQIIDVDSEQLTPLPPIRTVLQSGRKGEAASVNVTLHARLTEIGTLEMWCAESTGDRTWKLAFDVRITQRSDFAGHQGEAESAGVVDESIIECCRQTIRAHFSKSSTLRPESLVKKLEEAAGMARAEWAPTLMRAMWEAAMEVEPSRRISDQHEARWLNLAGYLLRPGFGLAVDDWRVSQMWRLYPQRVVHAKNELVRAEWWILWRRLAGGLSAGQQQTLAQPLLGALRDRIRMPGSGGRNREPAYQFGPHETAEVWRALGSMELLPTDIKIELGQMLIDLLSRDRPRDLHEAALFALGRIGARLPLYGPLNALVDAQTAGEWANSIVDSNRHPGPSGQFAVVQLTRRTGDRYRDVDDKTRANASSWLSEKGAAAHYLTLVREGGQLEAEEQRSAFGETLPRGLRIE